MMVGLATVTPILGSSNATAEETFETVPPDPTVVAVVDGPGGIGYWVVAADGSVEVIGTSIVPPLGEREPITDRVRTAYAGVRGALGIWLELADGTKLAVGDPGPSIFTGHDRPPGWLSGLAVKQLMAGSWVDEIDRGCVTELPRAVRIGQLLLPTMTESQFGAAVEESRDHQIAGILLSGGATPWIGRRISELQDFAGRIPLLMAADEEGGRVQRLHHVLPNLPSAARQVNERLELVAQRAERHAVQMLDLGFDGIGRPDCRSGVKAIVDYVRHVRSQSVIVVADVDSHGAGQKGAETLAAVLAAYVTSLRVIQPPNKTKDARDWKRLGATRGDVLAVTGLADEFHIDIKVTQG